MGDEARDYDEKGLNTTLMRLDLILWRTNRADNLAPICKWRSPCLGYRTCPRLPSQRVTEPISILLTLGPVSSRTSVLLLKESEAERVGMVVLHSDTVGELDWAPFQLPPNFWEEALGITRSLGSSPTFKLEDPSWAPYLATPMRLQWPGCSLLCSRYPRVRHSAGCSMHII